MVRQLQLGQLNIGMKNLLTTLIIVLSLGGQILPGQTFETTILSNIGLGYQMRDKMVYDPGFSGAGIRMDRAQNFLDTRLSIINGVEFSYLGWGSQLLVNSGFDYSIIEPRDSTKSKLSLSIRFHALNGISLFKPKPLYAGALEIGPKINYALKENMKIFLFTGFRYSFCPAYQDYGSIWTYSDIPLAIGLTWTLN